MGWPTNDRRTPANTGAAVSRRIARLEHELGLLLFDRSFRRIRLTRAGERLLPEAHALLAGEERIRQVAHDIASGAAEC
ncbi:MAG: LysR family transcriptional regulator [Streptomyces sp.]|nr:LysR family transcriptional regulator [Streptomyces sp.]